MNKPYTPTTHGAWRVIDGQLVDESQLPAADPTNAYADAPDPAARVDPEPPTLPRRKAPSNAE